MFIKLKLLPRKILSLITWSKNFRKKFLLLILVWSGWFVLNLLFVVFSKPRFECSQVAAALEIPEVVSFFPEFSKDNRLAGQTFLTMPEWYIVFSAKEYATVLEKSWPSRFRYSAASKQYWQLYNCMYRHVSDGYPTNSESDLVLDVIGASFTVENTLRSMHEFGLGRISELLATRKSAEDLLSTKIAHKYADSLNTTPWYEFDFFSAWVSTWKLGQPGQTPLRTLDRKYFLGSEYLGKTVYGYLIRKATEQTYDPADPTTTLVTDFIPQSFLIENYEARVLARRVFTYKSYSLLRLPRYSAILPFLRKLDEGNLQIYAMSGNSEVLVSFFTKAGSDVELPGRKVFSAEDLTDSSRDRVGWLLPVSMFKTLFLLEKEGKIILEHVYDF